MVNGPTYHNVLVLKRLNCARFVRQECPSVCLHPSSNNYILTCLYVLLVSHIHTTTCMCENVFAKSGGSEVMESLRRSVEPWLVDVLRNISV